MGAGALATDEPRDAQEDREMPKRDPFATPSEWCDRFCERCPLAWECAACRDEQHHDFSAPRPPIAPADDIVRTAVVPFVSGRRGKRREVVHPERGSELRHRANALFGAVDQIVGDHLTDEGTTTADELFAAALSLVTSCWRIADAAERDLTGPRWRLFEPLLLLTEQIDERVGGLCQRLAAETDPVRVMWIEDMRQDLQALLRPFWQHVGRRPRAVLMSLIERGEAPSPFCKVWPDWQHRIEAERVITGLGHAVRPHGSAS